MVTLLPLIHSTALLLLLFVKSYCVDGRTWISRSVVVVGNRQNPWTFLLSRPLRRPLSIRGTPNKFRDGLVFKRAASSLHQFGARGGHSTHHEEQHHLETSSTSTAITTSTLATTSITTSLSRSPNAIEHGGTIQRRTPFEEINNGTLATAATTTAKLPCKNETIPTLSRMTEAKKEAKEQRKKEKEAKKRHKQIAKQLRVCNNQYVNHLFVIFAFLLSSGL
jgi:hypothetical protein